MLSLSTDRLYLKNCIETDLFKVNVNLKYLDI